MRTTIIKKLPLFIFIAVILSFFYGCEKAAPLDNTALVEIGSEMIKIVTKNGYEAPLNIEMQIKVYREAFEECGYSYSATLNNIANDGFNYWTEASLVLFIIPYLDNLSSAKNYLTAEEYKSAQKILLMFEQQAQNW